jgi:hypothetical protein
MKQLLIIGGIGLIAYALYQQYNKKGGCGCSKLTDVTVTKDNLQPATPASDVKVGAGTMAAVPQSLQPMIPQTQIQSAPDANPAAGVTLSSFSQPVAA